MSSENEIKQRTVYLLQRTDKIYDGTDIYVGSTSTSLRERLRKLRDRSKLEKYENTKLYKKMCEVGVDSWKIISLLSIECDKKTILKLEKEKYDELNEDLNTYSPFSEENRKEYNANYYMLNIRSKKYRCELCEIVCGSNRDLQKHLKTPKHFWKYIYSVD